MWILGDHLKILPTAESQKWYPPSYHHQYGGKISNIYFSFLSSFLHSYLSSSVLPMHSQTPLKRDKQETIVAEHFAFRLRIDVYFYRLNECDIDTWGSKFFFFFLLLTWGSIRNPDSPTKKREMNQVYIYNVSTMGEAQCFPYLYISSFTSFSQISEYLYLHFIDENPRR